MYDKNYEIKYGHINNVKIKDLTVKELKNLKTALSHNKLLVKIISEVIKEKTTINVNDELKKLLEEEEKIIVDANPISNKELSAIVIPLDLELDENDINYAISNGIKNEYIKVLFKNFKLYYIEKGNVRSFKGFKSKFIKQEFIEYYFSEC